MSKDRKWLFVVNAGSNQVSMFRIDGDRLALVDIVASGGVYPNSLAERDGRLWVLNAGGQPNVTAFDINPGGKLIAVAGSARAISTPPPVLGNQINIFYAPSQIAFSDDQRIMLVVVKDQDKGGRVYGLQMGVDGLPLNVQRISDSADVAPIGAAFGPNGLFHVTDSRINTVSTYRVNAAGALSLVATSNVGNEGAPCWIVFTPGFAYVTNTSTGSISAFAVQANGQLSPLNPGGLTTLGPDARPTDVTVSRDGAFLATIDVSQGNVVNYRVGTNGALSLVNTVKVALPVQGVQGIASN